jgi:murein L,D-transpeptidase YafK
MRRLPLAVAAVIAAAMLSLLASPRLYEASLGFLRDAKRQFHAALGWPLPGTPDLKRLQERLAAKGLKRGAPVFMRIFKQEHELELWMLKGERYELFAVYPICAWSGDLGPKLREGDRQAPEGFYTVTRSQLNPNSRFHRSFNLGYPNLFDAGHGRSGAHLMVHGACVSIGCYAMTDPVIDEIWDLLNAAYDAGQARVGVHVFPFRMEGWRLALHRDSQWAEFWGDLAEGYRLFEATRIPPEISVCGKRYRAFAGRPGSSGGAELKNACPAGQS